MYRICQYSQVAVCVCCRFCLECSDEAVESVDITVSVGLMESTTSPSERQRQSDSESDSDNASFTSSESMGSGGGLFYAKGGLQLGGYDRGLQVVGGGLQLPQLVSSGSGGGTTGQRSGQKFQNRLKLKDIDHAPLE